MAIIDVGSAATDRNSIAGGGVTNISVVNPANATGFLISIDIYVQAEGNVKIGVFYTTNGNTWKCRSAADLGNRTVGLHSNIAVYMAISAGDCLGFYTPANVYLEYTNDAGDSSWNAAGDTCVVDDESTYTEYTPRTISLYGTGVTEMINAPFFGCNL